MGLPFKAKAHKETGNGRDITGRERGILILEDLLLSAVLAWVFYDSVFGLILVVPLAYLNHARYISSKRAKWERQFGVELRDLLAELISALKTGYSVERSFKEVERGMRSLHGDEGLFAADLSELNRKVGMSVPVEQAFLELAARYHQEDLMGFAEMFRFAKRMGGNYIENISRCAAKVSGRLAVSSEIALAVAEKQLELRVMMVMPLGVLLYMKISSPEFMDNVYHNLIGAVVMSVCLGIYAGAIYLGKRIVDIKV